MARDGPEARELMNSPAVSVIITVYNGAAFIGEALDSVLSQSMEDWECVVVDDGSTDATPKVLSSYTDPRIEMIQQPNRGRGAALNRACGAARGRYLAILDADDACLPERLARQSAFLDAHPDVGLVGADVEIVNETTGRRSAWHCPESDAGLRRAMARSMPFCHSAVMLRRDLWNEIGGYSERLPCALDYDLCARAMRVSQSASIPEVLGRKRIHADQFFLSGLATGLRQRVYTQRMLRAVSELRLPPTAYFLPVAYYLYARLPGPLNAAFRRLALALRLKRASP